MFLSPGVANGQALFDVAFAFALPVNHPRCGEPLPTRHHSVMVNWGGEWVSVGDLVPRYHVSHRYMFMVRGEGLPFGVRLEDQVSEDNFGVLMFTLSEIP